MEIADLKIGEVGEAKLDQMSGVLAAEFDVANPISIGGVVVGQISSKNALTIDEAAIISYFEKKYPSAIVVGALEVLKKGIQLIG